MKTRFVIFVGIYCLLVLYTSYKVGSITSIRANWTRVIVATILFAILGWEVAYRFGFPARNSLWFDIFAWTVGVAMSIWFTFLFFSLLVDAATSLIYGFFMFFSQAGSPQILHKIMFRWGPGFLVSFSIVLAGLGLWNIVKGAAIREVTIPLSPLPKTLEGLKIVQISDIHAGPTIRRRHVRRMVDTTMQQKPDIIVVTGDVADGKVESMTSELAALADLKAPLGVYYITGNHEYYWGAQRWIELARSWGFQPLINENRVVESEGVRILVAGVTDPAGSVFLPGHRPDVVTASVSQGDFGLRLLLAHQPESCIEAEAAGFDLQLSGHTHGGQFFPWNLVIPFFHTYHNGLYRHGKLWVYVTPGTGYWGPTNRFLIPSEIALIRLTSKG